MLDVHPPHHAASSWRDFFIHIATIVVGLLIAIGLEQTVEAIHHRQQLHQLEADLHTEGIRNLHIALDNIRASEQRRQTDAQQYAGLVQAGRDHRTAAALPTEHILYSKPAYAVWTVAQQSGTIGLLTREDAQCYARLYGVVQYAVDQVKDINSANDRRTIAMLPGVSDLAGFPALAQTGEPPRFDLSLLDPQDMRAARDAIGADLLNSRQSIKWNVYLYGVEWSVLHGSRSDEQNLHTIFAAMDVYLHGGIPALLTKYPLPE